MKVNTLVPGRYIGFLNSTLTWNGGFTGKMPVNDKKTTFQDLNSTLAWNCGTTGKMSINDNKLLFKISIQCWRRIVAPLER